jgi:hypothetical protein
MQIDASDRSAGRTRCRPCELAAIGTARQHILDARSYAHGQRREESAATGIAV